MMTRLTRHATFERARQGGTTLLEVLVAILILVFGLLGFVAMQSRIAAANVDAHGRAQAILLLSDMVGRIDANRVNAASYVASDIGTGDSQPTDCTGVAAGAARDTCEWSNAMKGAGEVKATLRVGAMAGARGCIEQIQAPDPTPGVCTRGIYRVTVVWQGMVKTEAPAITCGQNQFGAEEYRRAISARVAVGLPLCV